MQSIIPPPSSARPSPPGRRYRVAMGDYIFKTYSGLDYTDGTPTGTLLTDVLDSYLRARSPLAPDNEPRQRIE